DPRLERGHESPLDRRDGVLGLPASPRRLRAEDAAGGPGRLPQGPRGDRRGGRRVSGRTGRGGGHGFGVAHDRARASHRNPGARGLLRASAGVPRARRAKRRGVLRRGTRLARAPVRRRARGVGDRGFVRPDDPRPARAVDPPRDRGADPRARGDPLRLPADHPAGPDARARAARPRVRARRDLRAPPQGVACHRAQRASRPPDGRAHGVHHGGPAGPCRALRRTRRRLSRARDDRPAIENRTCGAGSRSEPTDRTPARLRITEKGASRAPGRARGPAYTGAYAGGDVMPEPDPREQQERYEKQIHELQTQVRFLEDEVALLRRRLTNAPRQVKILEDKLLQTKADLSRALAQKEKLSQPPASFGVYLSTNADGSVDVFTSGRKMRVNVAPELDASRFRRGAEVILNEALNVVEVLDPDRSGEVMKVKDRLGDDRVIVFGHGDEELVATLAGPLRDEPIRAGDPLLVDPRSNVAIERLPKEEVEELVLEEVPDVSYEDIGGLESQIEAIRDAVELPFLYSELFHEHQLDPPKGVLLYGPPGCGKTLIAKAVAKSLADKVRERTGRPDAHSYFLNIKGPELLNKYVGETERQIRQIFQRAKERSEEGLPVIVFFDEMDSIFRTRGSGISSDVENTIVPQLLSELDGVETLKNVIVIGASNREDLIDPAILRPGRLDVKIKIERPDAGQAVDIMSKYLNASVPIHPDEVRR